jgi:LPS export ABC transporter protein LptC
MVKDRNENLKFRIPIYLRILAFLIFAVCLIVVAYSIYLSRNQPKFVMKKMPAELSKDVVAVVNDYERLELDGQIPRYLVKAAKVTTFADNHQELENVYVEVYDETGQNVDKLSANRAIYIPTENKSFRVFFFGSVKIEARNRLIVRSEKISYDESSEIAESEGKTEFELENLSGSALNAKVFVNKSQIELFDNVQIFFHNGREQETRATEKLQQAQIKSKYAKFDREKQKIEFQGDVFVALQPKDENGKPAKPIETKTEKLTCFFDHEKIKRLELIEDIEFFQKPTNVDRSYLKANSSRATADFDGDLDKLELHGNAKVETQSIEGNNLTHASAQLIRYFRDSEKLELTGNAEISTFQQDKASYLRGNQIKAEFFSDRKIKNTFVLGNAYLRETTAGKVIESSANEMKVSYSDKHQLRDAHAIGSASITLTPSEARDYSKAIVFAPQAIRFMFENGALNQVQTEGRTSISLTAPPNKSNTSNRKLTADTIKTFFRTNGKEFLRAEAIGNVSLDVEPVENLSENYKTNVTATRLDCDFYEGNNIKTCVATKNAKVVQEPFDRNRSRRILTAEKLTADFNRENQQIERYEATGNAKYSEADRNATANQIIFTPQSDAIVRLRGGEPTIWDSKARAKAGEVDWDTRNEKSFLRGKVSTTYYNQRQTNGTTPFTNPSAPVYITSTEAEFDHRNEIARYFGNVRAWQGNNYVRAENLILYSRTRQMEGEGKVQSLLYDAPQRLPDGKEITQPVYASSEKISYIDEQRLLRYEGNVNIKQAADRLKAEIAEIFLDDKNEVKKTVAQKNVVITQPNRIATGDYAEYRADEKLVILRGNPATVQDAQEGQLQGVEMQFYLRENRFLNQGSEKPNIGNGRTRSVYKVRN